MSSSTIASRARAVLLRRRTAWRERRRFDAFRRQYGSVLRPTTGMHPVRRALVVAPKWPSLEVGLVLIKGLQLAGFSVVVLEHKPDIFGPYYRLAGIEEVRTWGEFAQDQPADWMSHASADLTRCRSIEDMLDVTWDGVRIGMLAMSTAMRKERVGRYDPANPRDRDVLVRHLARSRHSVVRARFMLDTIRPDLVTFVDTEYSPKGELFDLCLSAGIDTLAGDVAHRPGALLFKRYGIRNRQDQIASLSSDSWNLARELPWSEEYERRLTNELSGGYQTGEWYSGTRTQTHTRFVRAEDVRRMLHLDTRKRTVIVFAHIVWDAPFNWARPLFPTYEEWLIETVRAAIHNCHVNWVIKIHPAHVGKGVLEGYAGRPREMEVLLDEFGSLPPHVQVLPADSEISAHSIFGVMDCCVTVRGTVGIEAAVRGVPVVTAARARYSGLGFTYDSNTREEYLSRLSEIQNLSVLSNAAQQLAQRFAFGLFVMRPLQLHSVTWRAESPGIERQPARMTGQIHVTNASAWTGADDVNAFARWVSRSEAEDFLVAAKAAGRDHLCMY